jgi:hypothetical protein
MLWRFSVGTISIFISRVTLGTARNPVATVILYIVVDKTWVSITLCQKQTSLSKEHFTELHSNISRVTFGINLLFKNYVKISNNY